jgi:hypothetical protein
MVAQARKCWVGVDKRFECRTHDTFFSLSSIVPSRGTQNDCWLLASTSVLAIPLPRAAAWLAGRKPSADRRMPLCDQIPS